MKQELFLQVESNLRKAKAVVSVGNKNLPEEIILSIQPLNDEKGNFTVEYDYDGEMRSETTFNPFDRDDVSALLKRRPELEKKAQGFTLDTFKRLQQN